MSAAIDRRRGAIWLMVAAAVALLAAANWHLVHVAVMSQPDCVPHARTGEAGRGGFSAAQSSCTPHRAGEEAR